MRRDRRAHASTQHLSIWLEIIAEKVFLNIRVNMFSNTLKLDTKAHNAVRGEPH